MLVFKLIHRVKISASLVLGFNKHLHGVVEAVHDTDAARIFEDNVGEFFTKVNYFLQAVHINALRWVWNFLNYSSFGSVVYVE